MIRFACPRCKSIFTAHDRRAGSKVACLKCQQRLQIPIPPSANKTILAPLVGHGPGPGNFQPKPAANKDDPDWCNSLPSIQSGGDSIPPVDVEPASAPVAGSALNQAPLDESVQCRALNANQWAMFIHFSLLAGRIVPIAGWVLPIILWQMKKKEMPEIDAHGKLVCNWILTHLFYAVISIVVAIVLGVISMIPLIGCIGLVLLMLGIVLLFVGAILAIVYPIIGGIKANDGILWVYPGTIAFLK